MSFEHLPTDIREFLEGSGDSYDRAIRWRGHRFQVTEVKNLTPGYWQVVMRSLDEDRLPISVPASDLADAELDEALRSPAQRDGKSTGPLIDLRNETPPHP